MTVQPPTDSNYSTFPSCAFVKDASPPTAISSSGCSVSGLTSAQYDARIITLTLVVPTDYTCNTSVATGCWLKVKLDFTGAPADTTTWSASLLGDPVRLVESFSPTAEPITPSAPCASPAPESPAPAEVDRAPLAHPVGSAMYANVTFGIEVVQHDRAAPAAPVAGPRVGADRQLGPVDAVADTEAERHHLNEVDTTGLLLEQRLDPGLRQEPVAVEHPPFDTMLWTLAIDRALP